MIQNQRNHIYGIVGQTQIAASNIQELSNSLNSQKASINIDLLDPLSYARVIYQEPYEYNSNVTSNALSTNFVTCSQKFTIPNLTIENKIINTCANMQEHYKVMQFTLMDKKDKKPVQEPVQEPYNPY